MKHQVTNCPACTDDRPNPLLDTDHPDYGKPEVGSWEPEPEGITVQQLVEALHEFDPDLVIRVAQQPSWPLRARLTNLHEDDGFLWFATREISSHSESPYAPREAWDGVSVEEEDI
jgi:hypothetical protein